MNQLSLLQIYTLGSSTRLIKEAMPHFLYDYCLPAVKVRQLDRHIDRPTDRQIDRRGQKGVIWVSDVDMCASDGAPNCLG